jgi:hypothetical protein
VADEEIVPDLAAVPAAVLAPATPGPEPEVPSPEAAAPVSLTASPDEVPEPASPAPELPAPVATRVTDEHPASPSNNSTDVSRITELRIVALRIDDYPPTLIGQLGFAP